MRYAEILNELQRETYSDPSFDEVWSKISVMKSGPRLVLSAAKLLLQ